MLPRSIPSSLSLPLSLASFSLPRAGHVFWICRLHKFPSTDPFLPFFPFLCRVRVVPYKFHANAHFLSPRTHLRYPILCKQMMPLGVALQFPFLLPSRFSLLGLLKCVSHRSTACWIRVSLSVLALVLTHPLFDSRQQLFPLSSPPPACLPSLAPLSPMFICSICGWTIDTIVFASRQDLCYTPSLSLSLWAIFNYLYYVSVASLITLHNEFVDNDSGNIPRCFFQIFVNCRGYGYPVGHLSHTWWSEARLSRFLAFPFAVWLRFHHHHR